MSTIWTLLEQNMHAQKTLTAPCEKILAEEVPGGFEYLCWQTHLRSLPGYCTTTDMRHNEPLSHKRMGFHRGSEVVVRQLLPEWDTMGAHKIYAEVLGVNYCRLRYAQVERDVSVKIKFWVNFEFVFGGRSVFWHSKHRRIWTPPTLETCFQSTDSRLQLQFTALYLFWGVEVTMAGKHQQKESTHEACGKHTVEGGERTFVYFMS